METLAEFQERNCKGCFYADDEKVGTGRACCTYPQPLKLKDGKCLSKKGGNQKMSDQNENRPLMMEKEFATGLADLQVRDLVEYHGDDDLRLTDSGLDRAFDIWFSMSPMDRIIMRLFMGRVDAALKEANDGS